MNCDNQHALPQESETVNLNYLSTLKAHCQELSQNPLPLFASTKPNAADLDGIEKAAQKLEAFSHILILGTGGSSLGAQVLAQLNGWGTQAGADNGPKLYFLDNLSTRSLQKIMARYSVDQTAYLVVSKSGETPETLLQLSCVLSFLAEQNAAPDKHIVTLTEDKPSSLTRISQKLGLMTLPHDKNIGGRFSVLTNVGLLPARLAGVDIARVRQGAAQALDDFLNHDDAAQNMPLSGAALQIAHAQAGRNISVLMPYDERLDKLGLWFRQLWAESLGKKGRGTTPVNALGPVDQHSQLQLYLDGPDDKFYTLIETHSGPDDAALIADQGLENIAELSWLHNRSIDELVLAECQASYQALVNQKRPVRFLTLEKLDEEAIGALLMNLMLETICAAILLGVDAFDQPAVEQGKIIARQLMEETSKS